MHDVPQRFPFYTLALSSRYVTICPQRQAASKLVMLALQRYLRYEQDKQVGARVTLSKLEPKRQQVEKRCWVRIERMRSNVYATRFNGTTGTVYRCETNKKGTICVWLCKD